jgi:hypothetical protein
MTGFGRAGDSRRRRGSGALAVALGEQRGRGGCARRDRRVQRRRRRGVHGGRGRGSSRHAVVHATLCVSWTDTTARSHSPSPTPSHSIHSTRDTSSSTRRLRSCVHLTSVTSGSHTNTSCTNQTTRLSVCRRCIRNSKSRWQCVCRRRRRR